LDLNHFAGQIKEEQILQNANAKTRFIFLLTYLKRKGNQNILYKMFGFGQREISAIPHVWVAIMLMIPAVL
jgi:hypothetical protein